ncbi:MAG: hypothetical protein AB1726_03625 [Planctomycetota bacterium]
MDALARRIGISGRGLLTLAVVIGVLVAVSVPRLQSFAREENERDARQAAALLATRLPAARGAALPPLAELSRDLLPQLADAEFLAGGRALRRHGYVFAVRRLARPPAPREAVPAGSVLAVHAWPWRHGPSGTHSFLALDDGRLFRHSDPAGRWSGLSPPIDPWSWQGWRELR